MKYRKLIASLAALGAASILAVGCGGGSKDTGAGSSDLASKQELTVNLGKEDEPGNFVPAGMSYLNAINSKGFVQFAGLYRLEGKDNQVKPSLAVGEPEISKDGLTYTIKMREDANWSDGKPIVAQDLVDAVDYALDPKTGAYFASFLTSVVGACERLSGGDAKALAACPEPRTTGKVEEIGVTALDEHTVQIKLNRQVPWFKELLTIQIFYPLRKEQLDKLGKNYGQDPSTIVSGPFHLTEYKKGDHITYEKNDKYFDADKVKLDKLTFRMIAEATTAAAEFQRKRLDTGLQNVMFDAAEIDKWKADDRFISGQTVGSQYMYMNTRNKELSDPKVRQAIALAISRKDITENITKKGDKPTNIIVPPAVPGSDVWGQGAQDFLSTDGTPDATKAKDLLSEAGYKQSRPLNLYYSSDSGNAGAIAEQIQSNLTDIGIKTELKPTGGDVFSTVGIGISPEKDTTDLVLQGWIQDYFDAQDWYQLFYSKNIDAGLNNSNFSDPEYDRIYEEAIKTVDDDARYELYKQLEARLTGPDGMMPAAPLYVQADSTLVQPWVQGFELIPSGMLYWENVSITKH